MPRHSRAIILAAVALVTFIYGVGVGRWEWPPFHTLRSLKEATFPTELRPDVYALARMSLFQQTPGTAPVIMLGDSLTEHGNWSELFPNAHILNRGIGNDTSASVLSRLPEVVARRPNLVLLMIGINDILSGTPIDIIETNIRDIIQELDGANTVVQSTLYVSAQLPRAPRDMNARIAALNARLSLLCEEQGLSFLDLNAVLASGIQLQSRYTFDGIHLNGAAYLLWRNAISPYVIAASVNRNG